jgi:mRNA deadenylase 3'-5' endonuclease subunit Ccr4
MPLFNWNPQPGEHVLNSRFWIYCAFAVSITAVLFLLYFIWQIVKRKREKKREGERKTKQGRMRDVERGDMHKIKQG